MTPVINMREGLPDPFTPQMPSLPLQDAKLDNPQENQLRDAARASNTKMVPNPVRLSKPEDTS